MKPRYTDAFWGEHPFDGDMILIKNKNKNMCVPLMLVYVRCTSIKKKRELRS